MREGPNLYQYVWNNPIDLNDPLGLGYGFGAIVGGQGSAGLFAGNAGQASWGAGGFINTLNGGGSLGDFTSTGGYSGPMNGSNGVVGASAGIGGGVFWTNANSACELKGPFQQWDLNFPLFSINFASANGTWIASLTVGYSTPTVSGTAYTTTTGWASDLTFGPSDPDDFNPND